MQTINFKYIQLENFQGYGESNNTIPFTNSGLVRFVGDNGAGKSSVIVALETCLFNNNYKNIPLKDLANTKTSKGYKLILEFTANKIEYKIENRRQYESKSDTKLTLWQKFKNEKWVDISAHTITDTLEFIEGIIEVDYKTFNGLVSISADNVCPLLYGTDKDARDFLSRIFSFDKYDEFYKKIAVVYSSVNSEYDALENESIEVNVGIAEKQNSIDALRIPKKKPFKKLENKAEKLQQTYQDTLILISSLEIDLRKIKVTGKPETYSLQIENKKKQLNKLEKEVLAEWTKEEYFTVTSTLGQKDQEYKKLSKIDGIGTCKTCGQDIDQKSIQKRLGKLKGEIHKLQKTKDEQEVYFSTTSSIKRLYQDLATLTQSLESSHRKKLLTKDITDLKNGIVNSTEEVAFLQEEILGIKTQNALREKLLEQKKELISGSNILKKQKKFLEDKMSEVTKRLTALSILKDAYSNKGIKSFRIERTLLEINELLNKQDGILDQLSDGRLSARISAVKEGNKNQVIESINVTVADQLKELPFAAFSEGEKKQVALALVFVLHDLAPVKFNILMLDEVTSNLTLARRKKLFDILYDLGYTKSIFVVSHDDLEDVSMLFNSVYDFEKVRGYCTVKY